jgi:ABC-type siderophore export system fused ATPase/permease subunit
VIRHYIHQRRGELLLATVLCIASAAVSIVLLAHLNALAREGLQAALPGAAMKPVLAAAGLIAAMFLTNMAAQTFLARFGAATIADLRRDLSSRFLALDYQRLLELGKHQVTGALVADV